MDITVPLINNQCVCVVDRNRQDLAAVISSHFQLVGAYFPLFECPNITATAIEGEDPVDEHVISRARGREFNTMVHNALVRFSGCEYLILAGLSAEQKSYLKFAKHYKVIELDDLETTNRLIASISNTENLPEFRCRQENCLEGLILARDAGARLVLTPDAEDVKTELKKKEGLIIFENDDSVGAVIAINYAFAVNANVLMVAGLVEDESKVIQRDIECWKAGDINGYKAIVARVDKRISNIDINNYAYCTFFTEGLPYSLVLGNRIPFSYVNINLHPDLFVVNNILFNDGAHYNGAVIFSPLFFPDEETDVIIDVLTKNEFFCKTLLGKTATVRNLDYHLKEYPYDVLHICSHGGEVDGYEVQEEFIDRNGDKHIIEYDEVVGFAPEPGVDMIVVTSKQIFKKLDGMTWASKELKDKYGHDVFVDMQQSMRANFNKRSLTRKKKSRVPLSCAIKCSDSIHQGMFQTLSAHSSPLVFNNTCWSWFQIAESFLYGGARTYIGTLWGVDNHVASGMAKKFYENIFNSSILESFHEAAKTGDGTDSENIYIFWGLHFSTLKTGESIADSRKKIFRTLLKSFYMWKEKAESSQDDHVQKVSLELSKWIETEMRTNFKFDDMRDLFNKFMEKNPEEIRKLIELNKKKLESENIQTDDKPDDH